MSAKAVKLNRVAVEHRTEVVKGERFEFGKNWKAFLSTLTEEKIAKAEESLREMLEVERLDGKTFLDIGSGSGLFSLAARRLGATVCSFDFDGDSVNCGLELRSRFFPNDPDWRIEQGSALDREYLSSLGKFDVVYSWGVLHHTGSMWEALENAASAVGEKGKLFIAIYNDTGSQALRWRWIKKTYCRLPKPLKTSFAVIVTIPEELKALARNTFNGRPLDSIREWRDYRNKRGMNRWHDIIDWVGGYPYEFAGPTAIFDFYKARGFRLVSLKCDNAGLGCNEFVFERNG